MVAANLMQTIFSVNNNILGQLDAISSTRNFRNILWCEAKRIGLSPHKVIISLKTTLTDGGIDARVDVSPTTDSILIKGNTFYQVKSGSTFKPWQKNSIKKELFGSIAAKPCRESLAPGIRECLRMHGKYVIVTFGYDLTPKQQSTSKNIISDLIVSCGYKKSKIDVLGQSQLLGIISSFPSLSLDLLKRADLPFLNHTSWKERNDMLPPLHIASAQTAVIKNIQNTIRESKYQHIRVIGEPGIGKTRLVLEALSVEDLAPMVVYIPHAEDFQSSSLFNELLRADTKYYVILVIDECIEKDRASIWNALKSKKNIMLVTIDHGPELSRDAEMLVIDCPALPEDQIKEIIASYLPNRTNLSHWAQWCDGSPRVAHAVGENLQQNPDDLLKSPATIPMWERFIAGYEKLDSKNAQAALIVLRHVSLFTRFGFEDPVSTEAQFICKLVNNVDPSITWARFQEIVENLRKRRIIQGRQTLFIVPKALHIYLWIDYWNSYGRGFDFKNFFEIVPSQLQHWFINLFIYAHVSDVAMRVVENILCPNGPFAQKEFLVSEAGTRFLNNLAEADPPNTLNILELTFGIWSKEDLSEWNTGRQNIVWALEKIAVWREHFHRSANLLVKLALAENAKNSNNSTGILQGLFMIGNGWAATQAPPEERFPILEKLLSSNSWSNKELGLKLCETWLETYGGFRVIGPEYQGLRPTIKFWRPKTYGEIYNAWRLVWRHLYSISRVWQPDERCMANNMLIKIGFKLIHHSHVSNEVMDTIFTLSDDSATEIRFLTHRIISELKYRDKNMPKGISSKLRNLDKKITGSSFLGRFNRYILNTSWDEDYIYKSNDNIIESKNPSIKVKEIVIEVVADNSLFLKYLPLFVTSEGYRLYEFGKKLSETINSQETVDTIINAQLQTLPIMQSQFIGGYLYGIKKYAFDIWETSITKLLDNINARDLAIDIVHRSGFSEKILKKLIELFQHGLIKSTAFSRLAWQAKEDNISQALIEEVLNALLATNEIDALQMAIELTEYYFFNKENPKSCNENLLFRILSNNKYFDSKFEQKLGYHWHVIARGFRDRFPGRDIELFSVIISHLKDMSGLRDLSYPLRLADEIAKAHPDKTWSIISPMLEFEERYNYELIYWLGDEFGFEEHSQKGAINYFDANTVMNWVLQNPQKRADKLIRCLPKTLDENNDGKLTKLFLETFGNDDKLAESLIGHFWTGGWSGPRSAHLTHKRDSARQWISETRSANVLSWLYRYIEFLNKEIKHAELEEERRF